MNIDSRSFDTALPKWPMLHVTGDPVDPLRAASICIRTSGFPNIFTNNHEFEAQVSHLFGAPSHGTGKAL